MQLRNRMNLLGGAAMWSMMVLADDRVMVASESRDAASAYIGTSNFIVGRVARDCFESLERKDTPKEFVAIWQKRNERYYSAALAYMTARLDEAQAAGGEAAVQKVESAYAAAVRGNGVAAVEGMFKSGDRVDVCKKIVASIDAGAFDVTPEAKMYGELEALVSFVEANKRTVAE